MLKKIKEKYMDTIYSLRCMFLGILNGPEKY